jgi:Domain of unknown function (DUF4349)
VRMRMKIGFGLVTFLALAGTIGAACSGGMNGATGGAPAPMGTPADGSEGRAAVAGPATVEPGADGPAVLGEFQLPGITQRIIKTASVTIQVRKDTFEQRFQQAAMVASSHGGFISSSRTTEGNRPSGVLTIRVPASQFEAAMGELKGLGTVKSEQISGEDVTAHFVDLQSRLRNWEAQESVLLRLMRRSKTIEDSLKVQRTLQDVQLAIEEIRGQLRVLSDQTDLSTITLSMAEATRVAPKPKEGLTFVRAWRQAIHAIAAVFGAVVIGLGYAIPLALIALALLVMWFGLRRLRPKVAGGAPSETA